MRLNRNTIKNLIRISATPEDADKIIVHHYGFKTIEEKIAFLQGMFGILEVGHNHKDEATYYTMLYAIQHN